MPAIFPIPTGRVSSVQIQRRMLAHIASTQTGLLALQNQLATGRRIFTPSDDPPAATRAIGMQRLLEQKEQVKTNLQTSNAFLSIADATVSAISQLLIDVRGTAVTVASTTTSPAQREAAVLEIDRTIEQLISTGNKKFRGRHLFAGSQTTTRPFESSDGFVVYQGNESELPSYVDLDLLFSTNVDGNELFGTISPEIESDVDLNPVLTAAVKLVDLHGGVGIQGGSFVVSDGSSRRIIDISGAETVGDVARLIEANPPAGRQVTVDISSSGLIVDIDDVGGGNLSISKLDGGTTADQLGILSSLGNGTNPIVGTDLNPRLITSTDLNDVLGVRADATLKFAAEAVIAGFDDRQARLRVTASTPGLSLEDVTISFRAVNGQGVGTETAVYSALDKTLTIDIDDTFSTTAANVAAAITAEGTFSAVVAGNGTIDGALAEDLTVSAVSKADTIDVTAVRPGSDFNSVNISIATQTALGSTPLATYDDLAKTLTITVDDASNTSLEAIVTAIDGLAEFQAEATSAGNGNVDGTSTADTSATSTTAGGSGVALDQTSGLQITNGGETFVIDISNASTFEDLANKLNGSAANVLAEINDSGTGINVRSRLSGADFHIAENGGTTATQLGIRTFSRDTELKDVNYGRGVKSNSGTDFQISNNGFDLDVDVDQFQTVGELIDFIDTNHPFVQAGLVASGNGIQLVDTAPGGAALTVSNLAPGRAAADLGLIPAGQSQVGPAAPGGSLVGTDPNPLETKGVFNSLLRLRDAIIDFDLGEIERATAMLDVDIERVNFARAEIGTRGQALDSMAQRLDNEEIQVRQTLSEEIDVDLVEAISDLTAQQAALEASLRLIAQTFRISLLDFT